MRARRHSEVWVHPFSSVDLAVLLLLLDSPTLELLLLLSGLVFQYHDTLTI